MERFAIAVEVYKCVVLTIIALALIGIFARTPTPHTVRNLMDKAVDPRDIPVVRIQGGVQ